MTQRESGPRQTRTIQTSSRDSPSSLKRSSTRQDNGVSLDKMVESKTVIHIIEILGVVACAHHFWPKGVTYGEKEDWEKSHRKRREHGSKSKSSSGSGSGSGNSSSAGYRREKRDDREYEYDYEERPRHSRHASSRY